MNFLSPFALLLGTLAVPLLLLYFLKVRRRQMPVSSLLLWQAALRDREASTFFQRLQRDPLLILQILALLALTVALARPAVTVMGQGAKRVVIVMDTSASMKATDVSPSRFGQAQRAALGLLGRLGEGAEVMVVEAGVQPKVVVPFTREHDRVASALRSMEGHDLPNRLAEGLRTARALVGADPRAEIHVFTDGAHPEAAQAQGDDVRVRWTGVGRRSHNVGITSLAVRRSYFGTYNSQAFFSVGNFSAEPQTFSLRLTLDDETLTERTLTLDPQVRRAIVVPFSEQRGGVLKLKLDVSDDLDADNVAYAVIPAPRTLSVLLVSPGNLFLEKVLHPDPQVKLEVRKPDAYQGGMEGFDVVVVDSVSPPKLGNGRFVLVNTVPGDVPLEVLGRLDNPTIMDWDRTHPIMRQIDFAKVTIEDAMRVRPVAAGKTLVEAVGGPLIYALEERDRKALFFGFDLFRTDFPLRVAFPLILSKGLRWLSPVGLGQSSLQLQAGQPILLPVEHGVTTATVRTPSGRSVRAQVNRGMASFTDTDEVGIYAVVTGRGETKVAVNLMNADESDLTPQPVPTFVEGVRPESPPVLIQRELWPFFVMLALLLFALEGFLYWRRQTGGRLGLPRGLGDRWALGLRCALLAVLLLSLTKPTIPRWADRLNVTFLLDVSDSVSLAARESGYRFAAQSVAAMQPGDQAGVVVFGEEAMVDQPLRPTSKIERPQAHVPGRGTNLAQALQLGLATAPPGQANRFVLLTDGRQNMGNALAVAQAAKDAGADIYYVPAPLTFPQEVVVESMVLPQEVKFGEPFQAKVVAWSQAEAQGRLSLYRNGEFLGSQVVRGRPQVLLAEKDRAQAQALAAALRSQHVDVTVVEADKIPKDMAGLQKYDGLVLSNVSSLKMTKKQMENIRDYVREQGGGLIMLGGEESFGLGGYYRTPIEEALPVTMEVKQKIEIPSLAVVLSIDRSGSMAMTTDEKVTKLDIAKEAAHLVVDLLDERNEVGVMSWDTEFIWDSPLKPARDKQSIHHAIATIKAGGGTDGYPALKESYAVLFDRPALLKHVIFLSDGQMTRGDFQGLLRRMAKDKITVSTVAIGKDADVPLMVDVAKWGRGRFYYTEDDSTIPRIFTLETQLASKASLVEQPFKATVASPAHEAIQEIDWKEAPPLGGYVATSMKANADLVLMTHQEDPLLATWRYGLGRSVAFTSDAKAKWGVLWVRWGGFNKFWSQVTRWALRTGTRSDTVATVSRTDNVGEVTVDAIDPKGEFINFLDSQVGVVAPDKTRTVIDLEQVGPGRYRGRFPAGQEGVYLVGMAQRRADQMVGSQLAGLVVPYGQEFRDLGVDESFLRELTELTGGGILGEPKDAFLQNRHRSRLSVDIWPWLVGMVAMLLIPEIALRRIGPVGLGRLWARMRVGRAKGGPGHESPDRS